MPRDAVSRTANVERTGRHKWVNKVEKIFSCRSLRYAGLMEKLWSFAVYYAAKLLFFILLRKTIYQRKRNLFEILLHETEIRLYLPFSDWFLKANRHGPFAVPNQLENVEYNLISVWFSKISKRGLRMFYRQLAFKYRKIMLFFYVYYAILLCSFVVEIYLCIVLKNNKMYVWFILVN